MHERITIEDDSLEFGDWIADLDGLGAWLDEHPLASAVIDEWGLGIFSPNAEDLIGLERWDCPAGICSAVEDFSTDKCGSGFVASWCFS